MDQNRSYDVYHLSCGHLQGEEAAPERAVDQEIFCGTCETVRQIRSIDA